MQDFAGRTNWDLAARVLDLYGAFTFARTSPPAPYYELRVEGPGMREWLGEDRTVYFVPSRAVARTPSSWVKPPRALVRALRRAVRGLRPWPRPELAGVTVNGRAAAAEPYEAVLGDLPVAEPAPDLGTAVEIRVSFERKTAWTTTRRSLAYFPAQGILHRDTAWFRPPPEVARRIEADAGLAPARAEVPESRPVRALLAGVAAATLAALAAVAVALRRARRPRAASA